MAEKIEFPENAVFIRRSTAEEVSRHVGETKFPYYSIVNEDGLLCGVIGGAPSQAFRSADDMGALPAWVQ